MKVKVLPYKKGFYHDEIRNEGDIFSLNKAEDFSPSWMKDVNGVIPEEYKRSRVLPTSNAPVKGAGSDEMRIKELERQLTELKAAAAVKPDVTPAPLDGAVKLPNLSDVGTMSFDDLGRIIDAYSIEGDTKSTDDRRTTVTTYIEGLAG